MYDNLFYSFFVLKHKLFNPKFYLITEHDTSLREILKLPKNDNIINKLNNSTNRSLAERWSESMRKDNTSLNGDPRDESAIPISQDTMVTQKILLCKILEYSKFIIIKY